MSLGLVVVCAAASFASTLSAFVFAARQMGWRYGELFNGNKPTLLSIACLSLLLGKLIFSVTSGEISFLYALVPVPFAVLGSMIVHAVFRQNSGMLALVLAPSLSILAIFLPL